MIKEPLLLFNYKKLKTDGQLLINQGISAGFPSPADDFKEIRISLDKELVKNKDATFYARVDGDSMIGAGLNHGDLLVIDRSLNPENGKVAVCLIDGEFTVKRYLNNDGKICLRADSDLGNYPDINIIQSTDEFGNELGVLVKLRIFISLLSKSMVIAELVVLLKSTTASFSLLLKK